MVLSVSDIAFREDGVPKQEPHYSGAYFSILKGPAEEIATGSMAAKKIGELYNSISGEEVHVEFRGDGFSGQKFLCYAIKSDREVRLRVLTFSEIRNEIRVIQGDGVPLREFNRLRGEVEASGNF